MGRGKTTQENKTTAGGRVMNLSATCRVCNCPSAPHTHYGAVCCYSCRAFFRRGIHRAYQCVLGNSTCQVNSVNRTNCKKCRFDRCLLVGMNPNLVDASIKSKQIINSDNNALQPVSMEMIHPNSEADPFQLIIQLTQNQEGDNQSVLSHLQFENHMSNQHLQQNAGIGENIELLNQQLFQHQLHQLQLIQQHKVEQRKPVIKSKQKKGKRTGESKLIPCSLCLVDSVVSPSIDSELNPTVSPSNDSELNPIVVTATAVQHETEHLLNQLEECEDQVLSPFMIDPEFINEIAGMEDESNSTSTFSTDSTFSKQFSSSKESDKEFDELSEEFNLEDPGDGKGFPSNSAFDDFLLHGFSSSQPIKGIPFHPATNQHQNYDMSSTDLSPTELSSNDLSPTELSSNDLSKNLTGQGGNIVGMPNDVTYNHFNIKEANAMTYEHENTQDADVDNFDESYHNDDTLSQIIQNSLQQDTSEFAQSFQSSGSEELTYVFPIIEEEEGHDKSDTQPESLSRMENGLVEASDTNHGLVDAAKDESIGIDIEENTKEDDNIHVDDSDNSGLEDDVVCIQDSTIDNLEIKHEEIDMDHLLHLDFRQNINNQKKVELEARNYVNPQIKHISRNLFPHEKPPTVNIPGNNDVSVLPVHNPSRIFSPVPGPAGHLPSHQVNSRKISGRLSPYTRYSGGPSSYYTPAPTPHRSDYTPDPRLLHTPVRLTLPGRTPQSARSFQQAGFQVSADMSRVKYKARPTQLSYRDNSVSSHIPNLFRVSKEAASPNMAYYTTPPPSRESTSPDVTYNILSPPSRSQVVGRMNVQASVHQHNLQPRLNSKPLRPTNLFLQQSNFLSK